MKNILTSAFAFALFATASANAAVFVSVELTNPGTVYPTYSPPTSNPLADSITGTVQQNIIGSTPNVNRSPFDNTAGNPTPASAINAYTSVQAGGSATYNIESLPAFAPVPAGFPPFGLPASISFLWGSPDFFNKVEFFNGATSLGFVTGADLTNPNRNPPQDPATGQSWVILVPNGAWTSVVFSSTINAFEFTSLRGECSPEGNTCNPQIGPPAVPLPATLPLFLTGLGALGLIGRRTKRKRKLS